MGQREGVCARVVCSNPNSGCERRVSATKFAKRTKVPWFSTDGIPEIRELPRRDEIRPMVDVFGGRCDRLARSWCSGLEYDGWASQRAVSRRAESTMGQHSGVTGWSRAGVPRSVRQAVLTQVHTESLKLSDLPISSLFKTT